MTTTTSSYSIILNHIAKYDKIPNRSIIARYALRYPKPESFFENLDWESCKELVQQIQKHQKSDFITPQFYDQYILSLYYTVYQVALEIATELGIT